MVTREEVRADTILHFYDADDGSLANERSNKVYVGDESELGPVCCSNCESPVTWSSEIKEDSDG